MSAKIYWNLLVIFGVLCEGIFGKLSEKDIDQSSEFLDRQKRVVNRWPGGDVREKISNFPYIVTIKPFRKLDFCAGVILTNHIVLTVPKCVDNKLSVYRVYSGTSVVSHYSHPVIHRVTNKNILLSDHPHRQTDGIALITVTPAFIFSASTHKISLYEGPIHSEMHGTVSGWGYNPMGEPETKHPEHLRSITVPIISHHDCKILYHNTFPITESDICTLDATEKQYCGVDDAGAPLVVQVNGRIYLAGVHLWNGGVIGRCNPDVFVNLQDHRYKTWIVENIRSLEAHLSNHINQN